MLRGILKIGSTLSLFFVLPVVGRGLKTQNGMLNCCSRLHRKALPLQATQLSTRGGLGMTGVAPPYETSEWRYDNESYEPVAEFNVVTFNMLAPCYKRISGETSSTGRRERESDKSLIWNQRAVDTVSFFEKELLSASSIIALQEFWLDKEYFAMFANCFQKKGYELRTLKRSGSKMDAVAIAIKSDEFEIKGSEDVYLCSVGDRVALLLWLCHRQTGKNILVANTHLSFPHNVFDRMNQMRQMRKLTDAIDRYSKDHKVGPSTRIITGDFNSEVRSSVCDHLKSSGYQSSFEMSPPIQCGVNSRGSNNVIIGGDLNSGSARSEGGERRVDNIECPLRYSIDESMKNNGKSDEPMKRFVSHRTHTNEDLGVDHIFVRPEGPLTLEELAQETSRISMKAMAPSVKSFRINESQNPVLQSFEESKQNEEVYAELESDMDGIDTMRRFTEDVIADTKAYRSEEEEKMKSRILLLEQCEEDKEEQAKEKENLERHSNPLAPSRDILMSAAALSSMPIRLASNTLLFFANSRVIPTTIPLDTWSTEFVLSDHRPVSSSIILARPSAKN